MNKKKTSQPSKLLGVIYAVLVLVSGVAIVWKMVDIQWVNGDGWRERGERREAALRTEPAHRGNIYSSDGKILATTVPVCDFYLDLLDTIVRDEYGQPRHGRGGKPVESGPITDSLFHLYLDSVCLMLHEAVPSRPVDYYRERILSGRYAARQSRCLLVQRALPYSVWRDICRVPGWSHGVVRKVDGQSVVRQVRAHIYGNMAENVIGFRNSWESRSYTGLEGYYDSILRGRDGIYNCRRLTRGIWLPDPPADGDAVSLERQLGDDSVVIDTTYVQRKIDGLDIISTIDTRYQDIAESALRKALVTYGGRSGCAILMEMATGYVLACANLTIDTHAHDYRELADANVAVSDVYEPGSTFKGVILTAMLSDPAQRIDTTMKLRVGYKKFPGRDGEIKDDHTLEGRDSLSLKEVIEQSSNVGMSELGWIYYRNRRDTLEALVRKIFPYQRLNVDLKVREYATRINNLNASNRDFLNFCYGYSTRVTALQVLTFYNALGAGGRMVKPLFCRGVVDADGRVTPIKPVVLNERICSRETTRTMREMLEGVVLNGTGNNIKNNSYGIAGKTGTAVSDYRNMKLYNGSFAGFFPAKEPKYSCLVVIKHSPAYGRQAAVVFKTIADGVVAMDKELSSGAAFSRDDSTAVRQPIALRGNKAGLREAYKRIGLERTLPREAPYWVTYFAGDDSTAPGYRQLIATDGLVPDCTGMTVRDAIELLHSQGLRVKFSGYGKVVSQSPRPNTKCARGNTIYLTLK
ncbi:MAG: PASTA domain-containing protein [Bacteroidales bacterium]|nr:PASTA domain-containing protein [Bacteroidales bacterium]